MYIDRVFTVKISGKLDRYDIKEIEHYLREYMADEFITVEIVEEEIK